MNPVELLVVGDVHNQWDDVDERFLLSRDAVAVFVGDIGDEDVDLVRRIAGIPVEKGVMLGNHDAWWAMRGRSDPSRIDAQLDALGSSFLGYRAMSVAGGRIALVGARPFSWGGGWSSFHSFYRERFGVSSDEESATRMRDAAASVPDVPLVIVGHNGPRGLGTSERAMFGRDFHLPSIDFGDGDQERAIRMLRDDGRRVVAAIAGHMHHQLRFGGYRQRMIQRDGTTYLNAAVVPRHEHAPDGGTIRHFLRVVIEANQVTVAEDVWVGDQGEIARREDL